MRTLQNVSPEELTKKAELALAKLKNALQDEIRPFISYWKPNGKHSCYIAWLLKDAAENLDEDEGFYGTEDGLYLIETCEDEMTLCIFFPQSTGAYMKFFSAMEDLYNDNENVYYETIPGCIDVSFDGENEVELAFTMNLGDLDNCGKKGYKSAKTIAEDMVNLLSASANFEKISYYECDDENRVGYSPKLSNYYVGVKVIYTLS
jgi:hypothetical protein